MRLNKVSLTLSILSILLACLSGYFFYRFTTTERARYETETTLTQTLAEKTAAYTQISNEAAEAQERILVLEQTLAHTAQQLETLMQEKEELDGNLRAEKERNDAFDDQIQEIGDTVSTLDKLSKIDHELLMKYSKIYFLNEHYRPATLSEIPKELLYSDAEPKFIHTKVLPSLSSMIEAAAADGVTLLIKSAFRSFEEQKDLKGAYTVAYGNGANTFSADQGYSEHQLGTTVDITTSELGGNLSGFELTDAYLWLTTNAHKYGFVLSYPKNNAYYIFEPWHWRFVGEHLARELHTDAVYFYDLDQRKIDEYLISIFD